MNNINNINNINRKYTLIDELPELDDMAENNNSSMIPNEYTEKYQKVIRNHHIPSPESGMYHYSQVPKIPSIVKKKIDNYQRTNNNTDYQRPNNTDNYQRQSNNMIDNFYQRPSNNNVIEPNILQENFTNISCLDVANHIKSCPLCSKFYNTDKTIYIIAIVVLSLVCLLLLKKVLNM